MTSAARTKRPITHRPSRLSGAPAMPADIPDDELESIIELSTEVESLDYRNPEDFDDYFTSTLYRAPDGRSFRVVESSGMNSEFCGAGNFGEWLTEAEVRECR